MGQILLADWGWMRKEQEKSGVKGEMGEREREHEERPQR